jgi:cytochrome P450
MAAHATTPREGGLPPGPTHPSFVTAFHWVKRPLQYWEEIAAKHGDPFTMRLPGLPPLVVFSNPDAVKEVFTDDGETMHAGEFNQSLKAFLGEQSILMLDGKPHLRQRRLLLPPFHGERMQAYGRSMVDLTDASIDEWPLYRPFPIHERMQAITLRVIVRTIFGIEDGPRFEKLCAQLTELTDLAAWPPLLFPFMQKDLGAWSPWGKFQRKSKEVDRALLDEIARRRREGTVGRTDVLSLLIAARDENGEPLTDEELRDELVTLLVAGHETTATSLAWAFRFILADPQVEDRLRTELAGDPSPERIARLEYLDAVCRETLRLQPVIPLVGRVLTRPATVGGVSLPKGVAVLCSIYLAQRRPSVYPEPRRFKPERFIGVKMSQSEFFPFGGGLRRCVGMAFALYEMKMVLATVLARTRLRAARSDIKVVRRAITLTPSGGMPVIMESRRTRARA